MSAKINEGQGKSQIFYIAIWQIDKLLYKIALFRAVCTQTTKLSLYRLHGLKIVQR